jgi:DNA-binding transcriptional regulator LsrR (DeoR family)
LAAAYLASKRWKQAEIAELLQLTTGNVSKFISEARRSGRLSEVVDIRFNTEGLSKEELSRIERLAQPTSAADYLRELATRAGQRQPVVRVFGGDAPPSHEAPSNPLQRFSDDAAGHVLTLICGAKICGVSWGNTLKTLVDAIEQTPARPKRRRPVMFIPVAGEPLGKAPTSLSASTLAQRLDEIVNGDRRHRNSLSLAGVPAFVPRSVPSDDLPAIDRLMGFVDGYREVFGATQAGGSRIDRMDTLLTSLGPLGRPFGPSGSDFLTAAKLAWKELSELAIAEISGVLLEREQLTREQTHTLDAIRARWRGIRREHLAKCVSRAARARRPGVILIGLGKNRMQGVIEAATRGLVSELLIDRELAVALSHRATLTRQALDD